MKLSFVTGGWPFSLEECIVQAKEMRYQGLELSTESLARFARMGDPLSPARLSETVRQLNEADIDIACITAAAGWRTVNIPRLITLAHDLRCPFVALPFATDGLEAEEKTALLLPLAEKAGVTLLIPTAGSFADTGRLKALLDHFASDYLGAVWCVADAAAAGKTPEQIVTDLGAYIRHMHLEDGVVENGQAVKKLLGEGQLPLGDVFAALRSISYDGFFSFDWTPGEGALGQSDIVLSHYAALARSLGRDPRRARQRLYENNRHTGKYIFKKDALVELTFSRLLDRVVAEFPDQIAFRYTTLDYTRTYEQFREDVDECARALMAMGVRRGSKVAMWATNVPQWYIGFWATTKIGAVLVTVNTAYKIHEAEYLLRQSDTHTLIMVEGWRDADYSAIIRELCPELDSTPSGDPLHIKRLPFLRNIITVGFSMKGCIPWDQAMARAKRTPREALLRRADSVQPDDVCNMQYTSGTTGFPKGVMLTHRNIVNNGKCIGDRMDLSTADRMMIQVPMFHCFGMVLAMTASMTHGASLYPLPYFSPKPALACIHLHRHAGAPGFPQNRFFPHAHRHYGRLPLPHFRDAGRGGQNAHDGNHHRVRPDGSQPRLHHVLHRRPHRGAGGHRGPGAAGDRMQDRGPRNGGGSARQRDRGICGPGLQHHEGLLQNAQGHPVRHRQGRLAAHGRPGLPHPGGQLPHHRPAEGHDHPRRRKHLPQGDRGIHLHPSQGVRRTGHRRAGRAVRRRNHGRGDPERRTIHD